MVYSVLRDQNPILFISLDSCLRSFNTTCFRPSMSMNRCLFLLLDTDSVTAKFFFFWWGIVSPSPSLTDSSWLSITWLGAIIFTDLCIVMPHDNVFFFSPSHSSLLAMNLLCWVLCWRCFISCLLLYKDVALPPLNIIHPAQFEIRFAFITSSRLLSFAVIRLLAWHGTLRLTSDEITFLNRSNRYTINDHQYWDQ